DWPASRVAIMLQTAGADAISDEIARAAIASSVAAPTDEIRAADAIPHSVNRRGGLIPFLGLTHRKSAVPAARPMAGAVRDPEVLDGCLRLVNTDQHIEIVRSFVTHEDWRVRVQAVSALGRVGGPSEEHVLVPLISDREWWVRYRAAQALARVSSRDSNHLK